MEVAVAEALKPSLRREFIFQQSLGEELLRLNGNNVVVGGGDDFSVDVDDLLDFSNGEFPQLASLHYEQHHHQQHQQQQQQEDDGEEEEEEEEEEEKDSSSFSSLQSQDDESSNSNSAGVPIFCGELAVPDDDLAELEWVSHFVDDSLPELSLLYPIRPEQAQPELKARPPKKNQRFPSEMKFPTKARTSKAKKLNARACSFVSLFPTRPSCVEQLPSAKKQKKRAEAQESGGAQSQRRCSHCQVQKTPQWRTGPLGPKTLCNACGVRYKSGRLFAEYRPACSPTFSSDVHSNSHRKVLEIRKRKGMDGPDSGSVQSQLVPNC